MIKDIFNVTLWLAGFGHFIVLIASVQVPKIFGWKEDFAKLKPMNQKLVWTYAIYLFMTIFTFGVLTLIFHDQFLNGDPVALGLSAFIGLFWAGRIYLDLFSIKHDIWPKGKRFVVGHYLLSFLFYCLVLNYLGLFVWHVLI